METLYKRQRRLHKITKATGARRRCPHKAEVLHSIPLLPHSHLGWMALLKDHVFWRDDNGRVSCSNQWQTKKRRHNNMQSSRDLSPTPSLTDDNTPTDSDEANSVTSLDMSVVSSDNSEICFENVMEMDVLTNEDAMDEMFHSYINMDLLSK
jgi:hypothetical protein